MKKWSNNFTSKFSGQPEMQYLSRWDCWHLHLLLGGFFPLCLDYSETEILIELILQQQSIDMRLQHSNNEAYFFNGFI